MIDPLDVSKDNIWNYAQNKPTLVAKDLELFGVPKKVTYTILLARGVFKWLNVRRSLIKLKDLWKERIKRTYNYQINLKKSKDWHKGYRAAMEQCRKEVRILCHSERFTHVGDRDFDRDAFDFIQELENE
jgi:hypothetical protein